MSSWANVAAKNPPPPELEGHPDPNLLEGGTSDEVDHSVIQPVVLDVKQTHEFEKSVEQHESEQSAPAARQAKGAVSDAGSAAKQTANNVTNDGPAAADKAEASVKKAESKGKAAVNDVKAEGSKLAKDVKRKATDLEDRAVSEAKRGKKELEKADKKAHEEYRQNPQLYNSIIGVVNIAVLASVGYAAYSNWHKPRWDRSTIFGITAGLGAWFGVQSYFGYQEVEYQKRK